ncbi:MAG: hypothetical protein CMQ19_06570 [Gammaproteobacteria bacterium]|mgnify:CR=1 FL=1|nr:hypothetical protein [Gammaproteobacteria bacterium]|tara:strand:+ start:1748 stop:2341 length:594 start_codon:yes stop_codon:yes gene_type:complete
MRYYQVNLLRDPNHPDINKLLDYVHRRLIPDLGDRGLITYGIFQGLLGMATNDLYLVVSSETAFADQDQLDPGNEFKLAETINLVPTARPTDHAPRTREGVYVFRWFDVMNRDIEKIAELSAEAWLTFEPGYEAEVQCLFAEQDQESEQGKMLLITWYQDLSVWQDSRKPPVEAMDNFKRRHQLTLRAKPIATSLVT